MGCTDEGNYRGQLNNTTWRQGGKGEERESGTGIRERKAGGRVRMDRREREIG